MVAYRIAIGFTQELDAPTIGDHVLKPGLVAPGNRVVAAMPQVAKLAGDLPRRVVPCTASACTDHYFDLSGQTILIDDN